MRALLDVNVLIALLDADHSLHERWADDVSLLDKRVASAERIHGPRQVADVYLLALAVRRRGRLVTFAAGVSRDAVVGVDARHLLVI